MWVLVYKKFKQAFPGCSLAVGLIDRGDYITSFGRVGHFQKLESDEMAWLATLESHV